MRIRAAIAVLVFLTLLGLSCIPQVLPVDSASDPAQEDWPMFRHDASHTGYTSSYGPTDNVSILWKFRTGGGGPDKAVFSAPVVAEGIVYVGSNDNYLYALNASNGRQVWNQSTSREVRGSVAVSNGLVYTGLTIDRHSGVFAFNSSTGALVWNTTGFYVGESAPTVAYGKVYVASNFNSICCLEASSGALLWNSTITSGDYQFSGSPTVADNAVYVKEVGAVTALDAFTGKVKWVFGIPLPFYARYTTFTSTTLTVRGGLIPIGSSDGEIAYLDGVTGKKIGDFATKLQICIDAVTGAMIRDANVIVRQYPAIAAGYLYTGSEDGHVYCLDIENGNIKWSYDVTVEGQHGSKIIDTPPAVVDGVVYIGAQDEALNGNVIALTGDYAPKQAATFPWWTISAVAIAVAVLIVVTLKVFKTPKVKENIS